MATMKKLAGLVSIFLLLSTWVGLAEGQSIIHSRTFAPYVQLGRTTPASTTDTLYNPGGTLTYNGKAVVLADGSITGNAATATKLATARAINGVNFDGSAAIQIPSGTGTTVSSSGTNTVSVTTGNNAQTFVQSGTATNTYALPTGDLSTYIGATISPLRYTICKGNANNLTIDPGTGNFIAGGGAGKTMTNTVAGETYATMTLQLISSATSVNNWVIIGAHGSWVMTP